MTSNYSPITHYHIQILVFMSSSLISCRKVAVLGRTSSDINGIGYQTLYMKDRNNISDRRNKLLRY